MKKHYTIQNEFEKCLEDELNVYIDNGELDTDDCGAVILFSRKYGKTKEMLDYLIKNQNLTGEDVLENLEKICDLG